MFLFSSFTRYTCKKLYVIDGVSQSVFRGTFTPMERDPIGTCVEP